MAGGILGNVSLRESFLMEKFNSGALLLFDFPLAEFPSRWVGWVDGRYEGGAALWVDENFTIPLGSRI